MKDFLNYKIGREILEKGTIVAIHGGCYEIEFDNKDYENLICDEEKIFRVEDKEVECSNKKNKQENFEKNFLEIEIKKANDFIEEILGCGIHDCSDNKTRDCECLKNIIKELETQKKIVENLANTLSKEIYNKLGINPRIEDLIEQARMEVLKSENND